MKNKRLIALLAIATGAITISGIGVATYAGYAREVAIGKDVGIQRYLFLDVTNWNQYSPDVYIYLFNLDQSKTTYDDPAAKQWYKGTIYSGNVYWFYVPTKYENALFIRAKSGTALADIQAWVKDDDHIWNQTENIVLSDSYNAYCPVGIATATVAVTPGTMQLGQNPIFS